MSEQTPERVRQFRAQYNGASKNGRWLGYLQVALTLAGFAAVVVLLVVAPKGTTTDGGAAAEGGLSAQAWRDCANYFAERQLPVAAVEAYQAYLDKASLDNDARAKVCYTMAKLAIDAEQYDTALKYLYESEFLAPESDITEDVDKKVVLCLDKLGRRVDLRKELRKRTTLKRTPEDVGPDEVVLAEFAGEVITDRDLDVEIEKLPAYLRETVAGPEKKAEFLKNLVAQRLLADKARRLELDQDEEVQEQMAKQLDALIVQKLISDEVQSRVSVTPEDIERFYKAEIDRFTEREQAEVRIAKADSAEAVQAITEFPKETTQVRKGGRIQGMPPSDEAVKAVFAAEPGARVGPYELEGGWYLIEVVSKKPERVKPFEEVKDQAGQLFHMQKEQEELSALIERILDERDVKLHLDRLKSPEAPTDSKETTE